MICNNCGADIKEGKAFCSKCGHKNSVDLQYPQRFVKDSTFTEQTQGPPPLPQHSDLFSRNMQSNHAVIVPPPLIEGRRSNKPDSKKTKLLFILIGSIAAAFILIAGFFVAVKYSPIRHIINKSVFKADKRKQSAMPNVYGNPDKNIPASPALIEFTKQLCRKANEGRLEKKYFSHYFIADGLWDHVATMASSGIIKTARDELAEGEQYIENTSEDLLKPTPYCDIVYTHGLTDSQFVDEASYMLGYGFLDVEAMDMFNSAPELDGGGSFITDALVNNVRAMINKFEFSQYGKFMVRSKVDPTTGWAFLAAKNGEEWQILFGNHTLVKTIDESEVSDIADDIAKLNNYYDIYKKYVNYKFKLGGYHAIDEVIHQLAEQGIAFDDYVQQTRQADLDNLKQNAHSSAMRQSKVRMAEKVDCNWVYQAMMNSQRGSELSFQNLERAAKAMKLTECGAILINSENANSQGTSTTAYYLGKFSGKWSIIWEDFPILEPYKE